jgi:hypothetical protein
MADDTIHRTDGHTKAVFAFGRMQPPTEGHAYLIRSVIEVANNDADPSHSPNANEKHGSCGAMLHKSDPYIFPTSTHTEVGKSAGKSAKRRRTAKADAGAGAGESPTKSANAREAATLYNNPLMIDQKVKWLKKMFPEGVRIINTTSQDCKTIFKVLDKLLEAGYKDITVLVGADRKEDFETMFSNAKLAAALAAKEAVLSIRILPRPESAISGTKVRTMAARGKITEFVRSVKTGLMTDEDAREMLNEVRLGMGLEPIGASLEGGSAFQSRTRRKNRACK